MCRKQQKRGRDGKTTRKGSDKSRKNIKNIKYTRIVCERDILKTLICLFHLIDDEWKKEKKKRRRGGGNYELNKEQELNEPLKQTQIGATKTNTMPLPPSMDEMNEWLHERTNKQTKMK